MLPLIFTCFFFVLMIVFLTQKFCFCNFLFLFFYLPWSFLYIRIEIFINFGLTYIKTLSQNSVNNKMLSVYSRGIAFYSSVKISIESELTFQTRKNIVKLAVMFTQWHLLSYWNEQPFSALSFNLHQKWVINNLLPCRTCCLVHLLRLIYTYATLNRLAGVKTFISLCVCCCHIATYNHIYTAGATHVISLWVYLHRIDKL